MEQVRELKVQNDDLHRNEPPFHIIRMLSSEIRANKIVFKVKDKIQIHCVIIAKFVIERKDEILNPLERSKR